MLGEEAEEVNVPIEAIYVIASKFLDGAVKPWEWEMESERWLNWTMAVRSAFARAQRISQEQAAPKRRGKHRGT